MILKNFDRFKNKHVKNKKDFYKDDGSYFVDYDVMIHELHRFTHLPIWVCKLVYDAEEAILSEVGIIHE